MFGDNDKLILTLINAKNINGEIIPFQLSLPLTDSNYNIPQELVAVDVFEYHEGLINGGNIAFSIYIGETTNIDTLIKTDRISKLKIQNNLELESINSSVCIQNKSGTLIVFANIQENDIVVNNIEELISVIEFLSNNLRVIKNSVAKIKKLSNIN